MPLRRRATSAKPKPLSAFILFPKLPVELRLKVYTLHLHATTRFVQIHWDSRQRSFKSLKRVPPLLHTCQESRHEALKIYQLRFASSPELARVYFSYGQDILIIRWETLGPFPGRISRKMSDDEAGRLRHLMIAEQDLLSHAEEDGRELERFTGLTSIGVFCDPENVESGDEYGGLAMEQLGIEIGERYEENAHLGMEERWPEMVCLREDEDLPRCSRHWWFEGWNQRSAVVQRERWPKLLAEALLLTQFDEPEEDAMFLMNMLFMHAGQMP